MTIDEVIAFCCEKSNNIKLKAEPQVFIQLAEWLEELKMYKSLAPRELVSQKQKNDRVIEYSKGFDYGFKTGYNKAIDDFAKKLSLAFDETIEEYGFYPENLIRQVAEQLKAGGTE